MLFFAFLIGAAHVFTFASFVRFLARGADVIPSKDRGLVKFVWFVHKKIVQFKNIDL